MQKLTLKTSLADIGVVKTGTISDGHTIFNTEVVNLESALLIKVNEAFYVDTVTDLKRLDKDLIMLYNLGSHFEVVDDTPVTKKKRGKK